MFNLRPTNTKRIIFFILLDSILTPLTLYLAYNLRFNFDIPKEFLNSFWSIVVLLIIFKLISFYIFKIYKVAWRFFSIHDIKSIFIALLLSYFSAFIIYYIVPNLFNPFPRSVLIIDIFLSFIIISFVRFSKRLIMETGTSKSNPTLIIGATNSAQNIIKSFLNGEIGYYPVAIIDDNINDIYMQNVRVYRSDMIHTLIKEYSIKSVIIAKKLEKENLNKLVQEFNIFGIKDIKKAIILQDNTKLKRVTIEDLLSREPKDLDTNQIKNFINGKSVLVTGGGGSIGSEIVRQCKRYAAREIIVLEASEYNLYKIGEEIEDAILKLVNVTNRDRVFEVISLFSPDIVIHAAAYKHVPICEANIDSAIENNILGTINVIDASIEAKVKKVVVISTDKAVRPTNVMGATKRVTELYAGNIDSKDTQIVAVRFGNVLGSSGSVIPKFREQIKKGEAITVTHPDITRYFMLIPEACQLVLQAAAIAKGGELFILDMGEPVKIVDLAKTMIRLYGKEDEIEIKYTGLRPGEKLYEELLINDSDVRTEYDSITVAKPTEYDLDKLNKDIEDLLTCRDKLSKLQNILPEFNHQINK